MAEYIFKCDNDMKNPEWKEQILRCRDCRFYTDKPGLSEEKPERKYCFLFSYWDSEWNYDTYRYVEPDGFCAWGEVRE